MNSKNTTILYTYTIRRSFVARDLQMLEKHFSITPYTFKAEIKKYTPLSFIRQFFFLLFQGWRHDFFICFFAGYHSVWPALFARLTGKKCILFLGGTDCFHYPSFQYGNFTRKLYGKATCMSAKNATLLVPVSENLIESESGYYTTDSTRQGIYFWCRPLHVPYSVIPLEYNPSLFHPRAVDRRVNSFLTVAFGIEGSSYIRKGIDKMIMLASALPDCSFTILGCSPEEFPHSIPPNVNLIPPVPYEELPDHYSRHQFYVQLSIAEGFPSAICEAMLCECVPIGSAVAAIPAIISSYGFLVPLRDDAVIMNTIQQALAHPDKAMLGREAREHIMRTFSEGKREDALVELINRLKEKS